MREDLESSLSCERRLRLTECSHLRDGLITELSAAAQEEFSQGRAVEQEEHDGGLGTAAAYLQFLQALEGRQQPLQLSI